MWQGSFAWRCIPLLSTGAFPYCARLQGNAPGIESCTMLACSVSDFLSTPEVLAWCLYPGHFAGYPGLSMLAKSSA